MVARDENGRFVKGQTGNAGGRPKGLAERARAATRDGADIITFYVKIANDESVKVELRMEAFAWLADRGWGKAVQSLEHSGPEGGVLRIVVEEA